MEHLQPLSPAWLCVNGMRDICALSDGMQFSHLIANKLNSKISWPLVLRVQIVQMEFLESSQVLKQINVSIAGVAGAILSN